MAENKFYQFLYRAAAQPHMRRHSAVRSDVSHPEQQRYQMIAALLSRNLVGIEHK